MSFITPLRAALFATLISTPAIADRAPPPANYQIENNRLVLPTPITFETGTTTLSGSSRHGLRHIANYLGDKSYISLLRIEGHVAPGPDAQALSEKRAMAIARALVDTGVDCKRLLPVGFGDNKPVAANDTPEGRAQNTRIEAVNAALKDRLIGGMPADGGGRVAGDPCTKAP